MSIPTTEQQAAAHEIATTITQVVVAVRDLAEAMDLPALEALAKAKQWAIDVREAYKREPRS